MGPVTVFADIGVICAEDGVLPNALAELSVRLDIAGAGLLLEQLMFTCWAPHHGPGLLGCRCSTKKPPDPRPIPRPPPPPKPKGERT